MDHLPVSLLVLSHFLQTFGAQPIKPAKGVPYKPSKHEGELLKVPVRPVMGYRVHFCFYNCLEHQLNYGGDIIYGWALWLLKPGKYVAEHHSVWESPAGELFDVSPQSTSEVLFKADGNTIFDFRDLRGPFNFEYNNGKICWFAGDLESPEFAIAHRFGTQEDLEYINPIREMAFDRNLI